MVSSRCRLCWIAVLLVLPLLSFGQFSAKQYAVGNGLESSGSPIIADLNNDGLLDVVYWQFFREGPSGRFEIVVSYANGNQTFSEAVTIYEGDWTSLPIVVDVDNNGWLDIVLIRHIPNSIRNQTILLKNYGSSGFQSELFEVNGYEYLWVFNAGDVNLDGFTDLFVIDTDVPGVAQFVSYWLSGSANGTFTPQDTVDDVAPWPVPISADIDNDGDYDFFHAQDGRILVNNGNQEFVTQCLLGCNTYQDHFLWVDMEGDGDMDRVAVDYSLGNYRMEIYVNDGSGHIQDTLVTPYSFDGIGKLLSVDDNHDGFADFIYHDGGGNFFRVENVGGNYLDITGWCETSLSILAVDNGAGQSFYITGISAGYERIEIDLNGVPVNTHENINDQGTCRGSSLFDVDFDGQKDLLLAFRDSMSYAKGLGNGEFELPVPIQTNQGTHQGDMFWFADFDQDQDDDILVYSSVTRKLFWIENTGAVYIYHNLGVVQFGLNDLAILDYNNGLGPNISGSHGNLSVFSGTNDGAGNLAWASSSPVNGTPFVRRTLAFDVDDDGDDDYVRLNDEEIIPGIATGINAYDMDVADMDGDGIEDFVVIDWTSEAILWIRKTGPSQFDPPTVLVPDVRYGWSLKVADLNGDGVLDITFLEDPDQTVNYEYLLGYVLGLGNNTFGPKEYVNAVETSTRVTLEDMDDDGDLDILPMVLSYHSTWWYENFLNSPFRISGQTYYDANANGAYDAGDFHLPMLTVELNPNEGFAFSSDSGMFEFVVDSGIYEVVPSFDTGLWTLSSDSLTYSASVNSVNPVYTGAVFGVVPNGVQTIANAEVTIGFPRCGQVINHWVTVANEGNTIIDGVIAYRLDEDVSFVSSIPTPDSTANDWVYYSLDGLGFGALQAIQLQVQMPGATALNQQLSHEMLVLATNGDTLSQEVYEHGVFCSYDPNDKMEENGIGENGYIMAGDELEYTVRFQNTGNDTAYVVIIRDELSADLEWHSLQPIAWSHPVQVSVSSDGEATFLFENINLVDSATNPLGSQGFVKFRILSTSALQPGDELPNTAGIYFDQNPPIITNTVVNTVYSCSELVEFSLTTDELCAGLVPFHAWANQWDLSINNWYLGDSLLATGDLFNGELNLEESAWFKLESENALCPMVSDSAFISVENLSQPEIILPTTDFCEGVELVLSDASPQNYDRKWFFEGNEVSADTLEITTELGVDTIVLQAIGQTCPSVSDTVTLSVHPSPIALFEIDMDMICLGGFTSISTLSNGDQEWSINGESMGSQMDSFMPDTAGAYVIELVASEEFCSNDTMSLVVMAVENPEVSIIYDAQNQQFVAEPSNYANYAWYFNSSALTNSGSVLDSYGNGSYYVVVTDENGCTAQSELLDLSVGVYEPSRSGVRITPNPNTGSFTVKCSKESVIKGYQLLDVSGRIVTEDKLVGNAKQMQVQTELPSGTYLLRVNTSEGVIQQRIIITN